MNMYGEESGSTECVRKDNRHRTSISNYKSSWKQFDSASSNLLFNLCTCLGGSQYEAVTKDLVALLGPVFGCGESELVLGRLKEMDNLLSGLHPQTGNQERHDDNVQVMFRCLLLFVKLQAEYHQLCSTAISSVIEHLISSCDSQDNRDLVQQMKSLNMGKYTASRQSPSRSLGFKKSSGNIGSPKTQKQNSFKASLFSLFERKNSQEEGNSSFYVDIDNRETTGIERVDGAFEGGKSQCNETVGSQSDVLVQVGLDPSMYEAGTVTIEEPEGMQEPDSKHLLDVEQLSSGGKSPLSTGSTGQVATQEELNSVINLLSGVSVGLATIQTTPEHKGQMTLQVPSPHMGLSPSPASSDSSPAALSPRMSVKAQQRHSEGSIDLSAFSNHGNNTWPYHHRSSLPGGQLSTNAHISYDFTNVPIPSNYGNDFRPMTLPPGSAGHFQTGTKWGFPDPKLNRTWPVNNLAGTGFLTDTVNNTWSGFADSDDHSDDSSCDNQFPNQHPYGDPRQYSEEYRGEQRQEVRSKEIKHHSLEDLLEGRSNTWPQQLQPWSQTGLDLMEPPDPQAGFHRPVQMQRSDPLSHTYIWQNTDLQCPPPPPTVPGLGHM